MTYRCKNCNAVFYGVEELAAHLLSKHGLGRVDSPELSLPNLYVLVERLGKRVALLEVALGMGDAPLEN